MHLSCTVTEILGLKDIGLTTLTFWSRDVSNHVTIGLGVGTFLLVVNDDQASILHGYGDTRLQRFWGQEFDLLGSCDVIGQRHRVVWAIVRENPPIGLTCRSVNSKKVYIWEKNVRYTSSICREAPNGRICTKFCPGGRLADVITYFKFCVDRLRGFGSAQDRILPFSLDLAGRQ